MYEDNEYSEERNPRGSNGHRVHDSIGKQAGSFPPCAEAQSRNRSVVKEKAPVKHKHHHKHAKQVVKKVIVVKK